MSTCAAWLVAAATTTASTSTAATTSAASSSAGIDWASWVTAAATAALAIFASVTIRANRRLVAATEATVRATKDMVAASTAEAEATRQTAIAAQAEADATRAMVEEARRTRELEWQPFLVAGGPDMRRESGDGDTVRVRNIGRGLAVNVLVASTITGPGNTLRTSTAFALAAGAAVDVFVAPYGAVPGGVFTVDVARGEPQYGLIFCEDQFGRRYRFLPDQPRPDTFMPGVDEQPMWNEIWRCAQAG